MFTGNVINFAFENFNTVHITITIINLLLVKTLILNFKSGMEKYIRSKPLRIMETIKIQIYM